MIAGNWMAVIIVLGSIGKAWGQNLGTIPTETTKGFQSFAERQALAERKWKEGQVEKARKCGLPEPQKATEEDVERCEKVWALGLDPTTATRMEIVEAARRAAAGEAVAYRRERALHYGLDQDSTIEQINEKRRRTYILALNAVGRQLGDDASMEQIRPMLTEENREALAKKLGWGSASGGKGWDRLIGEVAQKGLSK